MKEEIHKQVESWVLEEDLPPRANLKPVSRFDGLYPEDQEEYEAYWDFIHWAMAQEHIVLLSIPTPKNEYDFWALDIDEFGNDTSAFNTMDFQRMYPDRFNKYAYKLKKIYEKVNDLAFLHSCISHDEGKKNTHNKFRNLVGKEFKDRAIILLDTYKKYGVWMNREKILTEVAALNSRIRKCNQIWKKYAYQD
jgi:hypothetical protein